MQPLSVELVWEGRLEPTEDTALRLSQALGRLSKVWPAATGWGRDDALSQRHPLGTPGSLQRALRDSVSLVDTPERARVPVRELSLTDAARLLSLHLVCDVPFEPSPPLRGNRLTLRLDGRVEPTSHACLCDLLLALVEPFEPRWAFVGGPTIHLDPDAPGSPTLGVLTFVSSRAEGSLGPLAAHEGRLGNARLARTRGGWLLTATEAPLGDARAAHEAALEALRDALRDALRGAPPHEHDRAAVSGRTSNVEDTSPSPTLESPGAGASAPAREPAVGLAEAPDLGRARTELEPPRPKAAPLELLATALSAGLPLPSPPVPPPPAPPPLVPEPLTDPSRGGAPAPPEGERAATPPARELTLAQLASIVVELRTYPAAEPLILARYHFDSRRDFDLVEAGFRARFAADEALRHDFHVKCQTYRAWLARQ